MDQDIRAQLDCREYQGLDPNRIDVELNRNSSCIGAIGSLSCVVVRNAETIRECIATALAPKKGVRVCPDRVGLTAKEKIRIELIRLGGALIRLKVE